MCIRDRLLEGRVPAKANEIVVRKYFLSTYGNNAKIGDTVTLDTESFHGDYVVTGIMNSVNAVSYTHLDVYKRQIRWLKETYNAQSVLIPCHDEEDGEVDVYKRQLLASAALSQLSYILEIDLYRGVKLMQLIPIGLFALAYLRFMAHSRFIASDLVAKDS